MRASDTFINRLERNGRHDAQLILKSVSGMNEAFEFTVNAWGGVRSAG